jgi:16S rRNA (adenine1518-N6/adenine1519-N6)-dimethyltransferase
MSDIKPKKHLGQHFLNDTGIAKSIVDSLIIEKKTKVIEIGPGMGVLTDFLFENDKIDLHLIEIDPESIAYLQRKWPFRQERIHELDFLRIDLKEFFSGEEFHVIGNFPYNISSQILFKVFENYTLVPQLVGMFQKEVAERIAAPPGSKTYGILSVLLQAYYKIEYLFTVNENVFTPPPKVKSGVIRLTRRENIVLGCNEKLFKTVIKQSFNQRRKVLRNSLKSLTRDEQLPERFVMERPEQLSVADFVELTNFIDKIQKNTQ